MRYGGLIIAIVIAAVAAFAVLKMSGNQSAPEQPKPVSQDIKTIDVYIATKPIPIGSVITEDMLASQKWPEHLAVDGFVRAGSETNPIGMVARGAFQQNEPLILAKLANPSDPNFLAGDLPAGMRVVTIPINEIDGVAGFVFPGDHVDLILTHEIDSWITPPGGSTNAEPQQTKETITETLLTNVKVLAIDQRASNSGATDKDGKLLIPKSASLMVSQENAQRVRLAQKTGTVSMVLRSLADRESVDEKILTDKSNISLVAPTDAGTEETIKVVRGAPATPKENESVGMETTRGAEGTSGLQVTKPVTSLPNGNAIINPALVGIP